MERVTHGLMLLCLTGAAASGASLADWPAKIDWRTVYAGVELAEVALDRPRPLRVFALRVDLGAEGVTVLTDVGNGERPEEVDGLKTSTFLVRNRCQAAINAAPFWPGQKEEDQPQNVAGLVVSAGQLLSPVDADKPRGALVVTDRGWAEVRRPPIDLHGVVTAVGGYGVVLEGGRVVRPAEVRSFVEDLHPRTAVGVAGGGRVLLLVVVDGRQPGVSEGVSLGELGEMLRLLGADVGLNLDGGGTSTMAVSDGRGGARLVNSPIEGGEPGSERVSASHLGVRASEIPQNATPTQGP